MNTIEGDVIFGDPADAGALSEPPFATAYRQACDAGWRFVRRRVRAGAAPRWFWYRQCGDICGDGLPRRDEAARRALLWDRTRPPMTAIKAAESDPRIVRIAWFPSGRWYWRNARGEMRSFRRLPWGGGAWGMVSLAVVDRRRKGSAGPGWVCFSAHGGVLARGAP